MIVHQSGLLFSNMYDLEDMQAQDKKRKNMKNIEKLIRKFKYLIHGIILLAGVVLIILAWANKTDTTTSMIYDVLTSIGCSAVATAVITLFLLAVLPDDSEENAELIAWGLKKIYAERRTATFPPTKCPTSKLDYVAFGLKHFRSAKGYEALLLKNIKHGLHVRILTLHPNSEYVRKQEKLENAAGLQADIKELIGWVKTLQSKLGKKAKGSIELKFYDCIPLHFYCRADSQIWVGPYLPGVASNNAVTYEFCVDSKGGKLYEDAFQDYWEGKRNVHLVNQDNPYLLGDQKLSIETVLKYFCTEMKKDDGSEIIGVVVLFKENQELRRTMFSCNKLNEEKYHCYGLHEGAVGKLIELNKPTTRVLFFRDYENDISVTFSRQGRNQGVKKIECSLDPLEKDTDMSAILAAPIYVDSKIVGAVTFDFNKPSSKYEGSVANLKDMGCGVDIDVDNVLHNWFYLAEHCAQIITHMLGDEIVIYYKELYEEEWKANG